MAYLLREQWNQPRPNSFLRIFCEVLEVIFKYEARALVTMNNVKQFRPIDLKMIS